MQPQLWTERSVEETMDVYKDWADSYDSDLAQKRYMTPDRIALALSDVLPDGSRPVLDFGCGTGLSGAALKRAGVGPIHGTDISPDMISQAKPKNLYEKLWISEPGSLNVDVGDYRAIVATGVVSLGAAPPETLDLLLNHLSAGDLLALSFNDPTLEHGTYDDHLKQSEKSGACETIFRQHGPHLEDMGMGSDVIILKRL